MKRLFQGLALGALLVAPAAAFAQDAEAEVTVPAAAEARFESASLSSDASMRSST